ncbi:NAD-dependent epimerase/dehydratase family protein [Chondromyces crocatus]|uniref:NAD-dependent epimerase n=1 Tax=Chondromyces crocatus TaxID=52 RepID=A0A0K1ELK8_CHOCO|nr:NAD(P)-dependent oxidoreductase [Chondromyces crocatus]AKT41498.1 NAD-dependent epimerase [Chondromyces crocatus]
MTTETTTPSAEPQALQGKALLTGASGFIGGRLRDALLARGLDVVAVRRRGSPVAKKGRSAEVEYEDVAGLERLMAEEKPDVVFHLAGATKGVTRDDFSRANVMPTRNLLEALKRAHPEVKRFVHVSTLAAYGPSSAAKPHVESSPRRPLEHYGDTKLEAEYVVEAAKELPWTILRPGGVYGPGDVDYFNLFREASQGRNVFFGNRNRWFSAVYVDDMVSAMLAAASHPGAVQQGFFVCDNEPLTWERFQQAIVDASGRRVRTLNLPEALVSLAAVGGELATRFDGKPRLFNRQKAKMGAQEAWTCRSDALRSVLGWNHEFGLERGIRAAFDWYRQEKWI